MTINFHFEHVFLSEDPWILLVSFTMYRIVSPNSEKILKAKNPLLFVAFIVMVNYEFSWKATISKYVVGLWFRDYSLFSCFLM